MAASNFDINTVMQDALQIITKQTDFYRRMPHTGGYSEPIIFLVIMAVVAGLILTFFSLFGASLGGAMAIGLWSVIMFPLFALIGSFVAGAIMFVVWKFMGSDKPYETAYRCVAYAGAIYPITVVLGLIPYVGSIVGIAWGMYLMVTASVEVHGLEARKAYIVLGVTGALVITFNVSNEMAARRMEARLEARLEQKGLTMEDLKNKSPEDLREMIGELMKEMEAAQNKEE